MRGRGTIEYLPHTGPALHEGQEEKASTHHVLGLHSMKELLLQGIANNIVLALHHKAVAGSPNKLQVSAPAHAKLLEGPNLAFADRQHPKVAFLDGHTFCWESFISQNLASV